MSPASKIRRWAIRHAKWIIQGEPEPSQPASTKSSEALPKCEKHDIIDCGIDGITPIGFCRLCWRKAKFDQCLGMWVVSEELVNTKFERPPPSSGNAFRDAMLKNRGITTNS